MSVRLRVVVALVGLVVAGAVTVVAFCVMRAGDPGHLDDAQWRRLTRRLLKRQQLPPHPLPSPPFDAAAAAPTPVPVGRLPRREPDSETLRRQAEEYDAQRPKTIVELQQYRYTQQAQLRDSSGAVIAASLINLNPQVNQWYLLFLRWDDGRSAQYHLANARPQSQDLELTSDYPDGLMLVDADGRVPCALLTAEVVPLAELARNNRTPVLGLCEERVVLRLPTAGNKTALEWSTDFLRDQVWGGEKITVFVRKTLFKDAFLASSELQRTRRVEMPPGGENPQAAAPPPLKVAPEEVGTQLEPVDLGITLDVEDQTRLTVGRWYSVTGSPGVWVCALQPGLVAQEILGRHLDVVNKLDEVEDRAQVVLVAFDLAHFELGFSIGTDHPRVGWSERVNEEMRDPLLPGPDGIDSIDPLVATGMVPTAVADRVAATFTGGFKRGHGAFKSSHLAQVSHGSHYGFLESGVVLSKLQPGLATVLVTVTGDVEMKTWTQEDQERLQRLSHARQNGVPLVELDPQSGEPRPGALVGRWGQGNWSGSQDRRLRTLRAGACLLETPARRFLVYGYFSSATPSAMARVFEACGCSYAMQLDINALEHTYLALYQVRHNELVVEHLISGMGVLDKQVSGQVLPRFLGFADNRDFFYLLRRDRGRPAKLETAARSQARSIG